MALFAPDPRPELLYRGRGCRGAATSATRAAWRCSRCSGSTRRSAGMVLDGADGDQIQRHAVEVRHGHAPAGWAAPGRAGADHARGSHRRGRRTRTSREAGSSHGTSSSTRWRTAAARSTRGRAEAPNHGRPDPALARAGALVVALRARPRPGAAWPALAVGPLTEAVQQSFRRLSSGVSLKTLVLFTGQLSAMLAGGLHLVRILTALAAESHQQAVQGGARAGARRHHRRARASPMRSARTRTSSTASTWPIVRAGELSGSLPHRARHPDPLPGEVGPAPAQGARRHRLPGRHPHRGAPDRVRHDREDRPGLRERVRPGQGRAARAHAPTPRGQRHRPRLHGARHAGRGRRWLSRLRGDPDRGGAAPLRRHQAPDVPLFGPLVRKAIIARICRTLAVLLNAGIPLIEAMETVSRVSRQPRDRGRPRRRHPADARRRHHRRDAQTDRPVPEHGHPARGHGRGERHPARDARARRQSTTSSRWTARWRPCPR